MKRFILLLALVVSAFFLGLYWENINIKGKTTQYKLYGITNWTSYSITGINPITKKEYYKDFKNISPFLPPRTRLEIYHDVSSDKEVYVEWKEDFWQCYDVKLHVY